jgi:hypothetical protein
MRAAELRRSGSIIPMANLQNISQQKSDDS